MLVSSLDFPHVLIMIGKAQFHQSTMHRLCFIEIIIESLKKPVFFPCFDVKEMKLIVLDWILTEFSQDSLQFSLQGTITFQVTFH